MKFLRKIGRVIVWQFGINPVKFYRAILCLPKFISDLLKFKSRYKGKLRIFPCLHDLNQAAGSTNEEYFWQDLYIAQQVFKCNPIKHVDIGSRLDGFISHLASFREVEVFDIRPNEIPINGVIFRQANLMSPLNHFKNYCDSLSCLHALEHFGLGRYGDPIDPFGYITGIENIASILKSGGVFYLSVPIGVACVEFNAHRVFNPTEILSLANNNNLVLKDFSWVSTDSRLTRSENPIKDLNELSLKSYSLGIFTFIKN